MKYLSTKIKYRKFLSDFPKKPKYKEIISFFEENGFGKAKIEPNGISCEKQMNSQSENSNVPIYAADKYKGFKIDKDNTEAYWIRFCKNGPVDKETNPVMFLYATKNGKPMTEVCSHATFDAYNESTKTKMTYDEILEYVYENF